MGEGKARACARGPLCPPSRAPARLGSAQPGVIVVFHSFIVSLVLLSLSLSLSLVYRYLPLMIAMAFVCLAVVRATATRAAPKIDKIQFSSSIKRALQTRRHLQRRVVVAPSRRRPDASQLDRELEVEPNAMRRSICRRQPGSPNEYPPALKAVQLAMSTSFGRFKGHINHVQLISLRLIIWGQSAEANESAEKDVSSSGRAPVCTAGVFISGLTLGLSAGQPVGQKVRPAIL